MARNSKQTRKTKRKTIAFPIDHETEQAALLSLERFKRRDRVWWYDVNGVRLEGIVGGFNRPFLVNVILQSPEDYDLEIGHPIGMLPDQLTKI